MPNDELTKSVESFWISEPDGSMFLIPDGTFNLIICSGETFLGETDQKPLEPGCYFRFISDLPVHLRSSDPLLSIRFKVFCSNSLLQRFSSHFKPVHNGVLFYLPPEQLLLSESFVHPDRRIEPEQRVERVVKALEPWALKHAEPVHSLRGMVNYLLEREGRTSVQQMQDDLGVSRQYIHSRFKRSMRVTPTQLSSIWRMNRFLIAMQDGESLTQASLESGFYDQSHGIRTFRRLLGASPTQFLRKYHSMLEFNLAQMRHRFQGGYDPKMSTAG